LKMDMLACLWGCPASDGMPTMRRTPFGPTAREPQWIPTIKEYNQNKAAAARVVCL